MKISLQRFLHKCWMLVAVCIITSAIITTVFRALTPWAAQYKEQLEQYISGILSETVAIDNLETGWYWFEPVIKLKHVKVLEDDKSILTVNKLLVGINLFSSLWHWQLKPGVLFIDDLHVNLQQTAAGWQVVGLANKNNMLDAASMQYFLAWCLAQQQIIIKHLSANIDLQDGSRVPLNNLNLSITNRANHYRIKGVAYFAQVPATKWEILANLKLNPDNLAQASGQVFFSVEHLLLKQGQQVLQSLLSDLTPISILRGQGDLQLWAEIKHGAFSLVQGKLLLQHAAWSTPHHRASNQFMPFLYANLAWSPLNNGWQLSGDHFRLNLAGVNWPENSFLLRYQNPQDYFVYLKQLSLEQIRSAMAVWPERMQQLLKQFKPKGQLHDIQVAFNANGIKTLLVRFANLGWEAVNNYPSVANLAGVLHWEINKGRLAIASENTVLTPKQLPALTFSDIDALLDWRELSDGMHVSLERFKLHHPNLQVTAQGVADPELPILTPPVEFGQSSMNERLACQVYAPVLCEVPTLPHSPTIDNLPKAPEHVIGPINLHAKFVAKDAEYWLPYLPYSHLKPTLAKWLANGVKRIEQAKGELNIVGKWADFPFDKSDSAGVFTIRSDLSGVDLIFAPHWPLTRNIAAHLNVDKRNLTTDILQADLQGIMVKKASLRVSDLGLDKEILHIQARAEPSAPEALSYIHKSPLKDKLKALNILQLYGPLALDLQLTVPLYPGHDKIAVFGALLFKHNQAFIAHMLDTFELKNLDGDLQFNQTGILNSNLHAGLLDNPITLKIKSLHKPIPATAIAINGRLDMAKLRDKYKLSMLSFLKGSLGVQSLLTLTDTPKGVNHLRLESSLEGLSINLLPPFDKKAKTKTKFIADIDLKPFKIAAHTNLNNYDLAIKASHAAPDTWSISIDHPKLAADLSYQMTDNLLKGMFTKLELGNNGEQTLASDLMKSIQPSSIPNLDLHIALLQLGQLNMGDVSLKTTSLNDQLQINHCSIKSPYYQITARGNWQVMKKAHHTTLQVDANINNLAKSLEDWHITPVVEATRGRVQFQGSWSAPIYAFALDKVNGELVLRVQNGRITNLSPGTEEKLGLGKLLSILSLQTIPRRLKLDFSDLSESGYSFDEFKGTFSIANGVMSTTNSYIDGPVAYASMQGKLDLAHQYYDLDLKVHPHITASLPIVATIAGGPVAGIATWFASKIINQGMQKISGYTYKITGPWQKPIVQEAKIIKKNPVVAHQ